MMLAHAAVVKNLRSAVVNKVQGDYSDDPSAQLISLYELLKQKNTNKLSLIIHVGTPKTGTSSIQTYLNKKQRKLRSKGILYPHNLDKLQHSTAPRHQWFEKNLLTNNLQRFLENLSNVIAQIKPDTHTIFLSSEGIYNYWWDLPSSSLSVLQELNELFTVKVWVWFREPLSFIDSFYKQCIRNPSVDSNPCYGKNLSLNDMLSIKWFSQHLNYRGFVDDCVSIFGSGSVNIFAYNNDVVQQLINQLGLATAHDNPTPRKNVSLHHASVMLLREINNYPIKAKEKRQLMPHIKAINKILDIYVDDSLINDGTKQAILAFYRPVSSPSFEIN